MKPDDLIKLVFLYEGQDYQARHLKCRKAHIVQARQRSMYLLKFFYPRMTWTKVAGYFNMEHDVAIYTYNKITGLIAVDKHYEKDMSELINRLRKDQIMIKNQERSSVYKMENKRVILSKTKQGYVFLLKRLNNDQIEIRSLSVSDEAMEAIIKMYHLIN